MGVGVRWISVDFVGWGIFANFAESIERRKTKEMSQDKNAINVVQKLCLMAQHVLFAHIVVQQILLKQNNPKTTINENKYQI